MRVHVDLLLLAKRELGLRYWFQFQPEKLLVNELNGQSLIGVTHLNPASTIRFCTEVNNVTCTHRNVLATLVEDNERNGLRMACNNETTHDQTSLQY